MSFGVPTDPNYIAFRDGYLKADDDITDALRWRWAPAHKAWFKYPPNKWILDDVSLPDTAGPWSGFLRPGSADLYLPDVYERVSADYRRYQARWPGLVWTWLGGGDWRVASSRTPGSSDEGDGDSDDDVIVTPECDRRVREVREWLRRGVITGADAQRMIHDIVATCTGTIGR